MGERGTSRSPQGKNQLLYRGGAFSKDVRKALEKANGVLISIPPQGDNDTLIPFVKEALSSWTHLQWIGYLSSTSVYGDHQGVWVDETSVTHPTTIFGRARLQAEQQWLTLGEKEGLPVHIFRLAGIYGPRRNLLEDLKAGKAQRIFKEGVVFSRIHVADIVQTLKASQENPIPGRIYNVADNCPASLADVVAYGAKLLGVDPPPLIPYQEANLTPMGRSFYQDSKKVCNQRLLQELIPSLLFPSYKEGLRALNLGL